MPQIDELQSIFMHPCIPALYLQTAAFVLVYRIFISIKVVYLDAIGEHSTSCIDGSKLLPHLLTREATGKDVLCSILNNALLEAFFKFVFNL